MLFLTRLVGCSIVVLALSLFSPGCGSGTKAQPSGDTKEAALPQAILPKDDSGKGPLVEQPAPKLELKAPKPLPPKEKAVLKNRDLVDTAKTKLAAIGAELSGNRIIVKSNDGSELLIAQVLIDGFNNVRFVEVKEPDFITWEGPEIDLTNRGLSYAKFIEIREGMDEFQVFRLIGEYGELVSSSGRNDNYIWRHPDGGNMVLSFEDGRVTGKTQLGLK